MSYGRPTIDNTAVRQKLLKNAAKYPVEKAKGVATKYDRFESLNPSC